MICLTASSGKAPSRAKALRAQADALDVVERLEPPFLAAKEAYQADPGSKAKRAAYNKAATKFAEARTASRANIVVSTDAGNATVVPGTIGGRR